jgi:hypothetical protein
MNSASKRPRAEQSATRTAPSSIRRPGVRFVGYPDPSQPYGTQFTLEGPVTPPAGQAPEVPYAAALPLIAVGVWGALQVRRHREVAGLR